MDFVNSNKKSWNMKTKPFIKNPLGFFFLPFDTITKKQKLVLGQKWPLWVKYYCSIIWIWIMLIRLKIENTLAIEDSTYFLSTGNIRFVFENLFAPVWHKKKNIKIFVLVLLIVLHQCGHTFCDIYSERSEVENWTRFVGEYLPPSTKSGGSGENRFRVNEKLNHNRV
jgi:hypothetical protein